MAYGTQLASRARNLPQRKQDGLGVGAFLYSFGSRPFQSSDAMSVVLKRLAVGGKATIYKAQGVYRQGSAALAPCIASQPLSEALASAKTRVDFLQVETLKGLPVKQDVTTKTIDPYLAASVIDMHKAFFGKK
eukprot:TRINITY_DN7396_c0_g1_i1.p2 TRINITY_DN7396_c0_g1~~TRINITY_DN7396_c0_g1_i1.p2  ORF type:complete len:149 (+),score=30.64 TRINITY_DN7396_c0_g1_i1:51-449(+)